MLPVIRRILRLSPSRNGFTNFGLPGLVESLVGLIRIPFSDYGQVCWGGFFALYIDGLHGDDAFADW